MNEKKSRKKGKIINIILVLMLLAGVVVVLYPTVSNWWKSLYATRAIASYVNAVEDLSDDEKAEMLEAARRYNESLPLGVRFTLSPEEYAVYERLLNVSGTGIMGFIQIPTIGVNLPVFHTVEDTVLQDAVGHIQGTSLPIGGETTHSVLSGHRGLPSARLLTDLDKVVEGDIFTVTVLDRTVTYLVDQILVVLPEETEALAIEKGEDYCTLVTCTPYGVNSHRLLVRGHRVENIYETEEVTQEALRLPSYLMFLAVGVPILFIALVIALLVFRKKKNQIERPEEKKE